MTLTEKLMEIDQLINADGGVAFIKIRMMLQDVEREIAKGNSNAIQFAKELDHILSFCQIAAKMPLGVE